MLKVGQITTVHGLKGTVVLSQIIDNTNWLKAGDVLYLELKRDSLIPYFVSSAKPSGKNEFLVNFDDVADAETAKTLLGKTAYAKEELLQTAKVDSPLMYIGYNMVDKTQGGIGAIEDVMLIGKQWIAKMTIEEKEVLIPLAEDWIIEVNHKNKFIRIDLPAGLLEVYLGSSENEDEQTGD